LPRKPSAQILGDIARPDVDQGSPTPEIEEARPQEPSQRKRDERDEKLPRKPSAQILGDIARPDVDQGLPTPGNEDANHPSNIERHPRKKD